MTTTKLISKVLDYAKINKSGFTLNIKTLEPIKSRYVASYKETQDSFSANDLQSVIAHALTHNNIVGGWYNNKDKRYYFDSNKIFDDLDEAIQFGLDNSQLAIFDIDNTNEIRLDNKTQTA